MGAFVREALLSIIALVLTHVAMFAIGVAYGERRHADMLDYALRGGDWKWSDGRLVHSENPHK